MIRTIFEMANLIMYNSVIEKLISYIFFKNNPSNRAIDTLDEKYTN